MASTTTDLSSQIIQSSVESARTGNENIARRSTKTYIHQRIQGLRLCGIVNHGKGFGTTPPFCPLAPTLDRRKNLNRKRKINPTSHGSPLKHLALTNHSKSTNYHLLRRVDHKSSHSFKTTSTMPHAISMPHSGFQALILCGPGIGLNTFTCVPSEFPKALINVANRPMVWYVLDWCYRMGVTDITLITPPASKDAMAAALAQNPYLTSLPSPSPDLLAPPDLEHTTPTAELLRLPQVQEVIKSDFLLLPCDLVCDISGEIFIDKYLSNLGGLGGISTKSKSNSLPTGPRKGGLSIWYNTSGREESVKNEECDFMATVQTAQEHKTLTTQQFLDGELPGSTLRQLVMTMPMSELKDQCEERKNWRVRRSLGRKHPNVKFNTQYRDSHIYFLPHWVKEFAKLNERFESVSEDLIGAWAKCDWRKPGYRAQFHVKDIFGTRRDPKKNEYHPTHDPIEDEIDLSSLSSTQTTPCTQSIASKPETRLASRVRADPDDSILSATQVSEEGTEDDSVPDIPPILAYVQNSAPGAPLIRRVDNTSLLLSVSLLLAKIISIEEATASKQTSTSPFAHSSKIAATASIAQKVTIARSDTLIDSNTSIATQCVIKSSVIGSSCTVNQGARLTNCLVMDGAVIGEKCVLTGTIIGKKAKVGKSCILQNCEVQDGNVVSDRTEGKNEKYMIGGLEDEDEEIDGLDDAGEDGNTGDDTEIATED